MSIYMYFENESTWPVSPETLTVHVVTPFWGGKLLSPSSFQQLKWGAAPGAWGELWEVCRMFFWDFSMGPEASGCGSGCSRKEVGG